MLKINKQSLHHYDDSLRRCGYCSMLYTLSGYYNNKEETARTIDKKGWLHTGDIGFVDDQDNVFIVDRIKELIKYKGFQVSS